MRRKRSKQAVTFTENKIKSFHVVWDKNIILGNLYVHNVNIKYLTAGKH